MMKILTYKEFYQQLSEFLNVEITKGRYSRFFILEGVKFHIHLDCSNDQDINEHVAILHLRDKNKYDRDVDFYTNLIGSEQNAKDHTDLFHLKDEEKHDVVCKIPTYYGHILNAALKGEDILRLNHYKGGKLVVVNIDQVVRDIYQYMEDQGFIEKTVKAVEF